MARCPRFGGGWQYLNTGGDWPYVSATHPFITAGVGSDIEMTTRLAFSIRARGMWRPNSP